MNPYEHLVGQHFRHEGVRYTVIKCVGATILTAYLDNNRVHTVEMSLADVLDQLEVVEINITVPVVEEESGEFYAHKIEYAWSSSDLPRHGNFYMAIESGSQPFQVPDSCHLSATINTYELYYCAN